MEHLFNHLPICSFTYCGNITQATTLLKEHFNKYFIPFDSGDCKVYLTSLNLSLYNYILLKENISLHKCCHANTLAINRCYTEESFIQLGKSIIYSYSHCTDYLVEKYSNLQIKKALHFIHEHLSEELSLTSIAETANMNPAYFSTLFKEETGYKLNDYISLRRVITSKKLLCDTQLPLDIIATRCGFNSYSYFCTIFKKCEGLCPSAFRLRARKE